MRVLTLSLVTVSRVYANEIQIAEANAALDSYLIGEGAYGLCRAFEHHAFQTVFVIEMHMGRRDHKIVMRMLDLGQALCQSALVMIEYVGEVGDAVLTLVPLQAPGLHGLTHEIPNGLRTVLIPARLHEFVKFFGKGFVERHGHALHRILQIE
jgi:hypothetical protein